MNLLQERLQSLLAGQKPALTPMPMPVPGPPPGAGGEQPWDNQVTNVFSPVSAGALGGFGQSPTQPISIPPELLQSQPGWEPLAPGSDVMQPVGQSPVGLGALSLIPLGGGQYIDPSTGQIHGLGNGALAY